MNFLKKSSEDKLKNLIKGKQCCKVSSIILKSLSDQVIGSGINVGFCSRPHFNTCSQTSISSIRKSSLLIREIKDFSESKVKSSDLKIFSGDLAIKLLKFAFRYFLFLLLFDTNKKLLVY